MSIIKPVFFPVRQVKRSDVKRQTGKLLFIKRQHDNFQNHNAILLNQFDICLILEIQREQTEEEKRSLLNQCKIKVVPIVYNIRYNNAHT